MVDLSFLGSIAAIVTATISGASYLKNRTRISISLSDNYQSFSLPGKYLKSKYLDTSFNNKMVALSVKVTNSGNKPITLSNIKVATDNDYIKALNVPFEFPIIRMRENKTGIANTIYYPTLAKYEQLPIRFKDNDTKEFQIVFLSDSALNSNNEITLYFDFGKFQKKITLKIPDLEDDHAQPDCTLA